MLIRYHQQIITLLIALLLWMPIAGLQAQIVDINKVNVAIADLTLVGLNGDERHSKDNCSAHPMVQEDNNCVSDGEACQYDNNCCGVNVLSSLEKSTNIYYITDGFLAATKSQSVPLLILPTEIKPPRILL